MALTLAEIAELKRLRDQARRKQSSSPAPVAAAPIPVPMEPSEPSGQPVETVTQPQVRKGLPEGYVPSEEELKKFLALWDTLEDYVANENALNLIFRHDSAFAANTDIRHVIIKCSALNDFYSTNIFKVYPVAANIISIKDFDARLVTGDDALVHEIALVDGRRNYSFASKYCSHHQPSLYPIFDSYVKDVLVELRKRNPEHFHFRKATDLENYSVFRSAIDDVRIAFNLKKYSYKDIDRYLWQLGKMYYNKYSKQKSLSV